MDDLPFDLPKASAKARARAERLLGMLDKHWSHAKCELNFTSPHELLVATILSAQATDAGVNKATPALFKAFPTPADYAAATPAQIEPYIKSIGLFRNKAKAVHAAMTAIARDFGGEVPRTMDELLTLRGVARKTANVVLGNAYGIQAGIPVDTHVQRLSRRFALVKPGTTVAMVERTLMSLFPPRPLVRCVAHAHLARPLPVQGPGSPLRGPRDLPRVRHGLRVPVTLRAARATAASASAPPPPAPPTPACP